jgi:DNA-binding response OmpR family regulator
MDKILIVEDDADLSFIMKIHLEHAGYETQNAYTCGEAYGLLKEREYDLVLLDYMLPDCTGDRLCEAIRVGITCPIIFVSCMDSSQTIINALSKGGDDYVTKPVNYEELLARIEAQLRRVRKYHPKGKQSEREDVLSFKQFMINRRSHKVIHLGGGNFHETEIELSPTEYSLLLLLVQNQNNLILYKEMYEYIWETDSLGDIRTVMVHISNLRKKLDLNKTGLISTVRNAGYIFYDI